MTNTEAAQARHPLPAPLRGRVVVTVSWTAATGLAWHVARRTPTGSTIALLSYAYLSQREARTAAWHFNRRDSLSARSA